MSESKRKPAKKSATPSAPEETATEAPESDSGEREAPEVAAETSEETHDAKARERTEKGSEDKGGSKAAPEPRVGKPKRGVIDTVMRGLVMVALGAFVTTPLWCQEQQTENFRRTTFRADRETGEDSTEGKLAEIIRRLITKAAQDQEVDEVEAMRELSTVLADASLGTAQGRAEKTGQLVGDILAQAAEADTGGFNQMQEQAVRGQSRIMARTLITELGGVLEDDTGDDPAGDWTNAAWPTISGFQYEEGMDLPAGAKALDGKDVKAWGYLLYLEGDQFLLVQSLWSCCFGQPPDLHEAIVVRADPNVASRFEGRGVKVYGRMEASEMREDGYVTSLYRLDARHIRAM
ncbi:MAG: hypothetical protein MUE69_10335 [Myxococcota bacterium]|jgi:hypothetical protein|nr:hypothetical protein [Myxococcota bacterium]